MKQLGHRTLDVPFHRDDQGILTASPTGDRGGRWTRHHMIPRSRGGKTVDSNLVRLRERPHRGFHEIFGNMTPEEVMVLVGVFLSPRGHITHIRITQKDRQVVLDQKKMKELRERGLEGMTMIGFQDMVRRELIRGVYRHRRKRERQKTAASRVAA